MHELMDNAPTWAPDQKNAPTPLRKRRRRLVVSCIECHRRKQKCDRGLPCASCKARNKASSCRYEKVAKVVVLQQEQQRTAKSPSPWSVGDKSNGDNQNSSDLSSMAATLGYSQADGSAVGILRKIEATGTITGDTSFVDPTATTESTVLPPEQARARARAQSQGQSSPAVREAFKGLIRQLPARVYLDRLISIFLDKFNYQYYQVDPDVLSRQLEEWDGLPFSVLHTRGPEGLSSPDMAVFPAVLFQMAATALLIVGEDGHLAREFAPLKYAASMTFEDLAADYSQSGVAVVGLFDKRSLTLTTVLAEFLRGTFLKYTAHVTESWHAIAMTIHDAQELGMHRDSLDPKPKDPSSPESILENEWLIQRRRRCYHVLAQWDIHMAALLGRPGVIDRTQELPTPPVDCVLPHGRPLGRTPIVPRDPDRDPPTTLTSITWLSEVNRPLVDIKALEKEGPRPRDFSDVERVHREILDIDARKPAVFRVDHPDDRWDRDRDTHWLRFMRYHFACQQANSIMLLHRPYIFHRRRSRDEALKASLLALDRASAMFEGMPPDYWRNYHLFYGSFDAVVTMSIIYILFPNENRDLGKDASQQFQWTIERFTAMRKRNALAGSAQGILRAIKSKLDRALGMSTATTVTPAKSMPSLGRTSDGETAPNRRQGTSVDDDGGIAPALATGGEEYIAMMHLGGNDASAAAAAAAAAAPDWTGLDLASLAPMYPSHDILFNELNAVDDGTAALPTTGLTPTAVGDDATGGADIPWHFDGVFGDDTVWQLLNQYQPGSTSG